MNSEKKIIFLVANEEQIISDKYWYFVINEEIVEKLGGTKKTAKKIESLLFDLLKKEHINALKYNNETFSEYLMFIYNVNNLGELKTILSKKEKLEETLYKEFVDFLPDIEIGEDDISEYLKEKEIKNISFHYSNDLMSFHRRIGENSCICFYNEKIPYYKNYKKTIKTIFKKEFRKIKKQLK